MSYYFDAFLDAPAHPLEDYCAPYEGRNYYVSGNVICDCVPVAHRSSWNRPGYDVMGLVAIDVQDLTVWPEDDGTAPAVPLLVGHYMRNHLAAVLNDDDWPAQVA